MDITKIIELVIELVLVIATTFLIPWIKAKTEAEKRQKAIDYVTIAVNAAEQLAKANNWDGEDKKDYVITYLTKRGLTVDYNEIDAMIEAAVLALKKELA